VSAEPAVAVVLTSPFGGGGGDGVVDIVGGGGGGGVGGAVVKLSRSTQLTHLLFSRSKISRITSFQTQFAVTSHLRVVGLK
jgi:hypothetical protein